MARVLGYVRDEAMVSVKVKLKIRDGVRVKVGLE